MGKQEQQITFAQRNHQLTNIHCWTPDSLWLVFDVRSDLKTFTGKTIERVNIMTGEVEQLYQATHGAHVGVVTVSPCPPIRYAFIHGPEFPDRHWQYAFHHRRGVIIDEASSMIPMNIDAMSITEPFLAGALRGGSHVHVFSPDGSRLSFTYHDHVMNQFDLKQDLRNVAIAVPLKKVEVTPQHPREYSGHYYCVVISRTTATPIVGSDQISRAYEECWIGDHGYKKNDGMQQRWSIAFIGDTLSQEGNIVPEIFVADLPTTLADYAIAGEQPLEGTSYTMPAPPASIHQRRITFTHQRLFPGLVTQPRFWLRSSPNGQYIAFLMRDDNGVIQIWLISPNGGEPYQLTFSNYDVQSAFSWHPDGHAIACVMDNSIMRCEVPSGALTRLTPKSTEVISGDAVVYAPDGNKIAYAKWIDGFKQLFYVDLSVTE